jgi:hypothetical protein
MGGVAVDGLLGACEMNTHFADECGWIRRLCVYWLPVLRNSRECSSSCRASNIARDHRFGSHGRE